MIAVDKLPVFTVIQAAINPIIRVGIRFHRLRCEILKSNADNKIAFASPKILMKTLNNIPLKRSSSAGAMINQVKVKTKNNKFKEYVGYISVNLIRHLREG